VLPRTYDNQVCSVARTLETIGDRWTMLVVRDAFLGVRRFEDFQRDLGIARNVLTDRLARLVDDGIFERHRYQERPERFEYRLTEKGIDLWLVMVSLMKWGDRYAAPDGPPMLVLHKGCGGEVDERFRCKSCGADVDARSSEARPGPAADRRSPIAVP
jgi:DNA-binding HxlR family transcriptional regulator